MKNKLEKYMMILATVFWAGAFITGKFSIEDFPVFSLVFFRFLIATIVIFAIMIKIEKNWRITKNDIKDFLILGTIGIIGYHVLFFLCLKYTTATNSSLIGSTNPIVTTIMACIFLKEKISYKSIIGIIISLFGVLLIATNGDISVLFNLDFNTGDILMMMAVLCWSSYNILSKKALEKYSPIKLTSYSFLTCIILLFPLVIMEKPWVYLPNVSVNGWISVIYMAIFPSVFGYLIQQISNKRIGPRKTSLYLNLVPVFSIILAFLILGESISIIKIVAAILIIAGICVNLIGKNNEYEKEIIVENEKI